MARELLLRGGYVVTVDDSLRDLPNGDVLIRDDQVAAVGRNLSTSTKECCEIATHCDARIKAGL
jgi:cytosine/adenosine deaminase-related metal-dependent hydrolase